MPATNDRPQHSDPDTPAALVQRMLRADRHLEAVVRHFWELGLFAEAVAVRDARDLLAGKCVRCREVHRQAPCPGFAE